MKTLVLLAAAVLIAGLRSPAYARSPQDNPKPTPVPNLSGLHDFDLKVGKWIAHHKRLKERLAGNHEWVEFDGLPAQAVLLVCGDAPALPPPATLKPPATPQPA